MPNSQGGLNQILSLDSQREQACYQSWGSSLLQTSVVPSWLLRKQIPSPRRASVVLHASQYPRSLYFLTVDGGLSKGLIFPQQTLGTTPCQASTRQGRSGICLASQPSPQYL